MDNFTAAIVVTCIGCILQLGIFDSFKVPLVASAIVGFALGDFNMGILMGAELQLIFMGATSVGASVPPNATVGSVIATALMIQSGQPMEAALALAVPVAVAGQAINILNRTVCTFLQHLSDRLVLNKNYNGVDISNYLGMLTKVIMYAFIFFPAVYFGSDAVEAIMNVIPEWVLHGLEVAGGMLPLVGFGMLLKYLNIKHLFPFFFIGFALATFGNFSMIGTTIIAICFAVLLDYFTNGFTIGGGSLTPVSAGVQNVAAPSDDLDALMEDDDDLLSAQPASSLSVKNTQGASLDNLDALMEADDDNLELDDNKMIVTESENSNNKDSFKYEVSNTIIKKKDLVRVFFRSFLLQICWNYERMQALGYCYCMLPILRKVYKNQPEKLADSVSRHNEFFNTNPLMSDFILGTTIAMEENAATGGNVDVNSINTVKISLMGPLAGIGDSLYFFTVVPIAQGIGISIAKEGSVMGPLIFLAIVISIEVIIRWLGVKEGYKLGVGFVEKLSSGVMQRVTSIATIVGLMVVGVMTATMVKVPLAINVGVEGATKSLLEIFDSFMPNLLPLAFTLLAFWLIKKGVSSTKILFGVLVFCVLGALIGLF